MEKLQQPESSCVYSKELNREAGYSVQRNKKTEFTVYSWTKETGVANLSRNSLSVGENSLGYKYEGGVKSFGGHFFFFLTLSTLGLSIPPGKICYLCLHGPAYVINKHSLRASSAPNANACNFCISKMLVVRLHYRLQILRDGLPHRWADF